MSQFGLVRTPVLDREEEGGTKGTRCLTDSTTRRLDINCDRISGVLEIVQGGAPIVQGGVPNCIALAALK